MCGRRSLYGKRANNRATGTIKGGSNMENVKIEMNNDTNKATIIIDLGYRGNLSPTGKSFRVASTCGSKTLSGTEIKLNLNAYITA